MYNINENYTIKINGYWIPIKKYRIEKETYRIEMARHWIQIQKYTIVMK